MQRGRGSRTVSVSSILDKSSAHKAVGAFSLSETDFSAVDSTFKESAVKLKDHMGGGYMASLEVFHQLHCLVCIVAVRNRRF